jgi:hypothetical protein
MMDEVENNTTGWNPEEYPEDHSPFCHKSCDHPCHDAYDQQKLQEAG